MSIDKVKLGRENIINIMKFPNSKKSNLGWQLLTVLYAAIFLTILILAYTNRLPHFLSKNDKLAHVILYCIATYLGHRVFKRRRLRILTCSLPLFPVLFGIFTTVEEICQSLSPYRTLDAMDLIASFIGIFLGYWLAQREKSLSERIQDKV
jgi:VanZ family protein